MIQYITTVKKWGIAVMSSAVSLLLVTTADLQAQSYGQTTPNKNKNYVRATQVLVGGVFNDADLNATGLGETSQEINYFDGLGLLQQQVQVAATPNRKDIIRPVVYDPLGREEKTYLPYESTGSSSWGVFTATTAALTAQKNFHNTLHGTTDGAYAYAQKRFEVSPLGRVLEESAPGNAWRMDGGHTSGVGYLSNTANEVRLWKVTGNIVEHNNAYYAKAQLFVTEGTDPDGRKVREYKNKQGQVIETRQVAANPANTLTTSYVYNNNGELEWVIPPKAQSLTPNSADFNKLVYRYKYSNKGLLTQKQLPGAEYEQYIYDNRDRLVMSQDGNQRAAKKWRVYYYDTQNRPVADGLVSAIKSGTTLYAVNDLESGHGSRIITPTRTADGYTFPTVTGLPTLTANGVLSYTFYDDYNWCPADAKYQYTPADFSVAAPVRMDIVKGQITGTKIKVLDGNEETPNAKWVTTITYYDNKYRPVQVKRDLYTGTTANGIATLSTAYLFDGAVDRVREKHVFNTTTTVTDLRYVYDHARRPVQVYHKVNNQAETLIAKTTYDALGRATRKVMGTAEEVVTYTYNIRNWLTQIYSAQFNAFICYNILPTLPSGSTATAQFGGNIAAVVSKQGTTETTYGYAYDEFSRLKEGIHTNNFNEKAIGYDANGNITTLTRQGGTNPGVFTYTYDGNKLSQLKIGSTAYNYAYDANGNATTDGMRGFTLAYNLLNLPKSVSKGSDKLEYIYDAAGNKLAKKKGANFTQYYAGGVVYKADKTPEYVMHGEGLALNVSGTFNYQYNINDHLGNTRLVRNAAKSVEQRNDYYPFGLSHATPSNLQKNKYLYNGKEMQDEVLSGTAFNELDYGARFYDPIIARWQVVDPLATKYYELSPYTYVANNPLKFIDPDGMRIGRPRPRYYVNPINYGYRPSSFRITKTYTYQMGHPTGARGRVSTPPVSYVSNYNTPRGNTSQMTNSNNKGQFIALLGDWLDLKYDEKQTYHYTSSGIKTETKIEIRFNDPVKQKEFEKRQLDYMNKLNEELSKFENTEPSEKKQKVSESSEFLMKALQKKIQETWVISKIGPSPTDQIINAIKENSDNLILEKKKREEIPQINQGGRSIPVN